MSANESHDESSRPEWNPPAPYFTMGAQVFMFVAIATVNTLTLVVMRMTPKLQTIPNTYISALAVSDLVVSVNQLIAIPWTFPAYHGYFEAHPPLCLFFKILLHSNELTSLFTIVLIGVDRFLYIRLPFWYIRVVTKAKVKAALSVMWVCCFATAVPIRLARSSERYPGCDAYALLYDSDLVGYVHGVLFFVICFTLFVSYGIVINTAVRQVKAIRAASQHIVVAAAALNGATQETTTTATATTTTHAVTAPARSSAAARRKESLNARMSLKIVKKMAGVFLVLFVFWSPYVVIGLIGPTTTSQEVVMMTGFLAAFNSAANFAVYALADREFRAATARVVCCARNIVRSTTTTGTLGSDNNNTHRHSHSAAAVDGVVVKDLQRGV